MGRKRVSYPQRTENGGKPTDGNLTRPCFRKRLLTSRFDQVRTRKIAEVRDMIARFRRGAASGQGEYGYQRVAKRQR